MKSFYCVWLMLILTALSLAQPATDFFIEKIVVDGNVRGAEELIVAQTRLSENETYSEGDLRAAMNRLQLQPFVLDANFKMERGSTKGKYQLRIQVEMQRRFFAQARSRYRKFDDFEGSWIDAVSFGANHFFGKHSQIYAAISPGWTWLDSFSQFNTGNIGYTNYHLFGSNLLFNIDLGFSEQPDDRLSNQLVLDFKQDPTVTLNLSYYLGGNQWVQSTYRRLRNKVVFKNPGDLEIGTSTDIPEPNVTERNFYSLSWERNTTDDSWEATRGSLYRVGYQGGRTTDSVINAPFFVTAPDSRFWSVDLDYAKFRPINFRHVFSYSGSLQISNNQDFNERRSSRVEIGGTYKVQLFDSLRQYRFGDAFMGVSLSGSYSDFETIPAIEGASSSGKSANLSFFLSYRGRWGLLRLEAGYVFRD